MLPLIVSVFLLFCPFYATQYVTSYNDTEARLLLNLSAGAYGSGLMLSDCVGSGIPHFDGEMILDTIKENCDPLKNPCEGYIVSSPEERRLYAVFRGTKTDSQLLLEGWSTLKPGQDFFGMGDVNSYFFKGHRLLWPDLNSTLRDPRYQGYSVIFTGHSLGGALAALAAARTARMGLRSNSQIRVVTFGEPRVGSKQFSDSYDQLISNSFRVVHRKDIVPHSPGCQKDMSPNAPHIGDSRPCDPTALDKSYHHGTEIWYPNDMGPGAQYIECLGLPKDEDFGCSDQFKFSLTKYKDYIADHRFYFDVRVPEFGKAGCNPEFPEGTPKP